MLKSVERLLEFVGDMNATEINDHIKARVVLLIIIVILLILSFDDNDNTPKYGA